MTTRTNLTSLLLLAVIACSCGLIAPLQARPEASVPAAAGVAIATTAQAGGIAVAPTLHWAATGQFESQVDLSGTGITRDAVVLYEHLLGLYPRLLDGGTKSENGGLPQLANIDAHLAKLARDLDTLIPDKNFAGLAVIDFESWSTTWDASPEAYRQKSIELSRQRNPGKTADQVARLAKAAFNSAARTFLERTLQACKQARPRAKWGIYGMPWSNQYDSPENQWLWDASDALFPNVYVDAKLVPHDQPKAGEASASLYEQRTRAAIAQARRLGGPNKPIYAIAWVRYHDKNPLVGGQMLAAGDLELMLRIPRQSGVQGIIFWDAIVDRPLAASYNEYFRTTLKKHLSLIYGDVKGLRQ